MTERTFTAAEMREHALMAQANDQWFDDAGRYRIAAMLRQAADADARWAQLKADVEKTAANYAADIEINPYRSGQKAHAKSVLAEMARIEGARA